MRQARNYVIFPQHEGTSVSTPTGCDAMQVHCRPIHYYMTLYFERKPKTNRNRVLLPLLKFIIRTLISNITFGKIVTNSFDFELYTHFKFKRTRLYQTNLECYPVKRVTIIPGAILGWEWIGVQPPLFGRQKDVKMKIMNITEEIEANSKGYRLVNLARSRSEIFY